MARYTEISDDDLPDLSTIILPRAQSKPLRRSPRKNTTAVAAASTATEQHHSRDPPHLTLSATSNQRRLSPQKNSPSKRSPLKTLSQVTESRPLLSDVPALPRKVQLSSTTASASAGNRQSGSRSLQQKLSGTGEEDLLLVSLSKLAVHDNSEDAESSVSTYISRKESHKVPTVVTEGRDRKGPNRKANSRAAIKEAYRPSRFVLDEARCNEDLVDSDAEDEGEDEDTDLSGFIVDDDAELSYHGSSEEMDSEEERRSRRKAQKEKPRRRLQRGRRKAIDEEEEEVEDDDILSRALSNVKLNVEDDKHQEHSEIEVIDLVSPEHKELDAKPKSGLFDPFSSGRVNLFDKFKALRLSPPKSGQSMDIPSKSQSTMWSLSTEEPEQHELNRRDDFTTPPGTPPRSPSKLKSPSKLLSPSKRDDAAQRSPHRQSMDAFWDLNEVNEWNDQFSPKKAPAKSPRKNRLAEFGIWSDVEENDSPEAIDESSDSLPSPCESPSKTKNRSASPVKSEKLRLVAEKKAKQAEKKQFEETKVQMALDLLAALDKHTTDSRISSLSASTGGVQIIWSKTLRSTAGRANWRRTVTKPSGSPVKGKAEESAPGAVVQHFANIELAVKVIDRPDRLVNTLAHEFCHLANFMVSGIRDQPHGASFQKWARKVTTWMQKQNEVPQWKTVEVTTKHGYVIEWKYLWLCVGREQNKAMECLAIDEEDGCGAEYGRHSKSINTDTQRCGRCKGHLVQVRPKPRASPVKNLKGTMTRAAAGRKTGTTSKGAGVLESMVEVIELSD